MEQQLSETESPKRVLVADDDAAICALLEKVLEPFAHVTSVSDAESALALLATQPPFDAIVSDFMLPGINGLEFVQRVRSDEQDVRVPILMISGHGRIVSDCAKAAGCDAFLDKPFTLAQLRATMRILLGPSVTFA
jgi:two-component system phosphate regulon response regulator PhoB